ncbi:hypothetical protein CTEN210_09653 [Chaetoceros tenuissimus]|uniref:MYND-type domain-containing protein n=1 Tax=Chaetoceros tenuissimus TaxID=426638 RepID=A0AAD3H783_9STRA|nr:hypothetical protein CTEN210_09653 [Chaetoceros tenuissimus]
MKNQSVLQLTTVPGRPPVNVATQKGANAYLRQLRKDGQPPFSTTLLVTINQYIHKPEESIKERWRSKTNRDNIDSNILYGLYLSMRNICTNASIDLLCEVVTDTELRIIFNHLVSLLKCAISRENKGVIIDEACLNEVMILIFNLIKDQNITDSTIQSYLKSLASVAKEATDVPSHDSGVGYFLCFSMIECFKNQKNFDKALMMMHKTGILEQVLRHIHLPWTPIANNNKILAELKNRIRFFFITIASCTISLSSIFKAGSPSRDALVDILEGRIKPCAENEHVIEILEALKKFLDMGLTSGNPDDKYISRSSFCCTKCKEVDHSRKLLFCGNCKHFGYCSRECQVADWKDHKQTCKSISSTLTKNSRRCEAIVTKFVTEHRNSIYEAMRKCYDGGDLVLDLNFSNQSSPALPPAFRNPPEFEVFPADIFWNRDKDKAPAGHWFFEDLGGGRTHFTDEDIKKMRGLDSKSDVSTRTSHLDLYVFMKLSDVPYAHPVSVSKVAMKPDFNEIEERRKSESYLQGRLNYIQRYSDQIAASLSENPDVKDISAPEKEEWVKKRREEFGKLYDTIQDMLHEKIIDN